jgi:hypothetical protein
MYMMRQRGDFECFMEPFETCAYFGEDRIFERFAATAAKADHTYANMLRALLEGAGRMQLFIKDHAYYIDHIANESFLQGFQHTFLIRDPAETLPSYFNKWPDLTFEETGFAAQRSLFDKVTQYSGREPVVIDANDLVAEPANTIRAYCVAVGIEFMPQALTWQPPAEQQPNGTWEGGLWHQYLGTSTGFKARSHSPYPDVCDNGTMQQFYERCLPDYRYLHARRLIC